MSLSQTVAAAAASVADGTTTHVDRQVLAAS